MAMDGNEQLLSELLLDHNARLLADYGQMTEQVGAYASAFGELRKFVAGEARKEKPEGVSVHEWSASKRAYQTVLRAMCGIADRHGIAGGR